MAKKRNAILRKPKAGRHYPMGRISSVFKFDGQETLSKYSVFGWWYEPKTSGVGQHLHPNHDHVFYVLEGVISFKIGRKWLNAKQGSYVQVPAGIAHDFLNRSSKRAGVLIFDIPGGFENNMPGIVSWFAENPPTKPKGK